MLYQHVRRPFWRRHPMVTGAAALLAAWLLLLIGGQELVAVTGISGLLIFVGRRRRALALRACRPALARNTSTGSASRAIPEGVYGLSTGTVGMVRRSQNGWQLRYFDGAVWTPYTSRR